MIVVPNLKSTINTSEYLRSQTVDASDFLVKIEELNRIYARSLGQSSGLKFATPWSTNSSTFTTASTNNLPDLKTWSGLIFLEREGAAGSVGVRFSGYGSGIEIRTIITRINSNNTVSTFTNDFSSASTNGWFGGVVNFNNAQRRSLSNSANPPAPFMVSIQARATNLPTFAKLDSFIFYEDVLTQGVMP